MIIEKLKEWIKEEEEEQENKMEQIFHNSKEPTKRKLRKRINTLEGENEVLKNAIKDELYKIFMKKLAEPEESKRYKEDASNIGVQREIGQNTLGLNKLSNSINEYKQLLQSIESLPEEDKKYFENKDGKKELDIKIKEYDNKLKDIGNEAVKAKQAILQIEDENR